MIESTEALDEFEVAVWNRRADAEAGRSCQPPAAPSAAPAAKALVDVA
ncbi:hypothetical protein ACXX9E_28780 [Pseudomonas sp. GNP014]